MNLSGTKLVVIGGAGLIGSHCVDALLAHDVREIVVYDNFSRGRLENLATALTDPRVRVFEAGGDILHPDILASALEGADGVFHLAALWLLQCHEFPRAAFEVNVLGTFNVLDACVRQRVRRLVYSSSASVYGDALAVPMTEDHPFNNRNFYGATKISGEAMLRAYHHRYGLHYAGLRYMNVYGPRQEFTGPYVSVIMRMLEAMDRGEGPMVVGSGDEQFDFVAAQDCAAANVCAMQAEATDRFYNIGTGVGTSLLELAETLRALTGCEQPTRFVPGTGAGGVRNRVGSTDRAAADLGFRASTPLEQGLRALVRWRAEARAAMTAPASRSGAAPGVAT